MVNKLLQSILGLNGSKDLAIKREHDQAKLAIVKVTNEVRVMEKNIRKTRTYIIGMAAGIIKT